MTVTYTAKPAPNIQWFHNDTLLVPSDDFEIVSDERQSCLVITDTMPEDSGLYKVILTNPHGDAVSAVSVDVIEEDVIEEEERVGQMVRQIAEDIIVEEVVLDEELSMTDAAVAQPMKVTVTETPSETVTSLTQADMIVQDEKADEVASLKPEHVHNVDTKVDINVQSSIGEAHAPLTQVAPEMQEQPMVDAQLTSKVEVASATPSQMTVDHQQQSSETVPSTEVTTSISEEPLLASQSVVQTPIDSVVAKDTNTPSSVVEPQESTTQVLPALQVEKMLECENSSAVHLASATPSEVLVVASLPEQEKSPQQADVVTEQQKPKEAAALKPENIQSVISSSIEVDEGEKDAAVVTASVADVVIEQKTPKEAINLQPEDVQSVASSSVAVDAGEQDAIVTASVADQLIVKETVHTVSEDVATIAPESQTSAQVTLEQSKPLEDLIPTKVAAAVIEQQLATPTAISKTAIDSSIPEKIDIPTTISAEAMISASATPSESITTLEETQTLTAESKSETHSKDEVVPLVSKVVPTLQLSMAGQVVEEKEASMVEAPVAAVTPISTDLQNVSIETGNAAVQQEQLATSIKVLQTDTLTSSSLEKVVPDSTVPEEIVTIPAKPDVSTSQALEMPTITDKSLEIDFDLNQDMELSVEFSAHPVADVTWFKDDEEISETDKLM